MSIQGLKKLQVWVRAKDFAVKAYKQVLPLLPPEEKWNLNQQIRRSATSVSANIAEGYGRFYYQDNVRFCYNARGSLEETLSHLLFCFEVGFISEGLYKELEKEGEEIEKMLNGYIAFLKKSKQGENEPGANYKVREDSEPYEFEPTEDPDGFEDTAH
ncbi:MAG: four helix bundle protein [Chloroflexi bacterium]|nr:four helix bundle protein [Chloroflexi bacterium CFX1]MCK6566525.1 four helix bundle protein [Anaerolineales bacterium]MCQ3954590.1 four helix bundle protein [Chloroflexota bacterium]MDL1918077.1 four helix bundle protein [Chloroflexi bacterium CFX5]RIK53937.1 MAG: four helix bundle protein [Chloroflexota bacterium]